MNDGAPTTVTATGIARIAGVGRAAVSNWRRRYADFPRPVAGTSASPVYDLAEVSAWLGEQGKLSQIGAWELLWRRAEAAVPGRIAEALGLVGMILVLAPSQLPGPRDLEETLRSEIGEQADLLVPLIPDHWSPAQRELLTAALVLGEEKAPVELFEYLHQQYISSRASVGVDDTPGPVAELMLELAGSGEDVFDYCCGTGSLLRAAYRRGLETGHEVRVFGQDSTAAHARIAFLRLLLLGREAGTSPTGGVRVGDSLLADADPDLVVDSVVSNPPFGLQDWGHEQLSYDSRWEFGGLPPRTEPELAWVQHALAHLKPGCRAALLMPPAAAARSAGRRIRGELVRRGALQAVIAIPAGAVPGTSVGLHIWVLHRPLSSDIGGDHVLLIDLARERRADPGYRRTVLGFWQTYLDEPTAIQTTAGTARSVPVIELLDESVDLTPIHRLPPPASVRRGVESIAALHRDFEARLDAVRNEMPNSLACLESASSQPPRATLDGLSRTGALSLWRARSGGSDRQELLAVIGRDVMTGQAPSGRMQSEEEILIAAGDILVPAIADRIIARVATAAQIGARLGPGVHLIRVDHETLDPWYVAGVLGTVENTQRAAGAMTEIRQATRLDVKRLRIPMVSLSAQREYGAAFRQLFAFEQSVAHLAELGVELTLSLTEGLVDGALDPEGFAGTEARPEQGE